jgi:hypothetical protein
MKTALFLLIVAVIIVIVTAPTYAGTKVKSIEGGLATLENLRSAEAYTKCLGKRVATDEEIAKEKAKPKTATNLSAVAMTSSMILYSSSPDACYCGSFCLLGLDAAGADLGPLRTAIRNLTEKIEKAVDELEVR